MYMSNVSSIPPVPDLPTQSGQRAMWHYLVESVNIDANHLTAMLNNLGDKGWELTSVIPNQTDKGLRGFYLFLRRPGSWKQSD